MHKDSYHAHLHNKQTNTTMSCIRNTYMVTCIRIPSQNFLRSYLCNVQVGSLLLLVLSNLPYVILYRVLVINLHFQFYIRETIFLTYIYHVMLNIESSVIEPHTERRWSTDKSRTKCDIAFQVDPLASILWWKHSYGTWRYM